LVEFGHQPLCGCVCNISLAYVGVHVWCVDGHGEGQVETDRVDGLEVMKNKDQDGRKTDRDG
jgi:hypothetical protein